MAQALSITIAVDGRCTAVAAPGGFDAASVARFDAASRPVLVGGAGGVAAASLAKAVAAVEGRWRSRG